MDTLDNQNKFTFSNKCLIFKHLTIIFYNIELILTSIMLLYKIRTVVAKIIY